MSSSYSTVFCIYVIKPCIKYRQNYIVSFRIESKLTAYWYSIPELLKVGLAYTARALNVVFWFFFLNVWYKEILKSFLFSSIVYYPFATNTNVFCFLILNRLRRAIPLVFFLLLLWKSNLIDYYDFFIR